MPIVFRWITPWVTAGLLIGLQAAEPVLTPQEIRGRTIYQEGKSASGQPITAILSGGAEVSGMFCANCHGKDGRGRSEGGVTPPRIRWEDLSRPYETSDETGRRHGPYSVRLLIRAIAMGLDPAGNKLGDAMPRFSLTRSDADDLIAYLKKIGADHDPGLSDLAIRIGVMPSAAETTAAVADPLRAALTAYFVDLNNSGGVYGRRIELAFQDAPRRPAATPAALANFLREQSVFALIGTFIAGAEKESMALLNREKVPSIGARTLLPGTNAGADPYVFYLDSGVAGQADALADFALNKYAAPDWKPVILAGEDELSQAALDAARPRLAESQTTAFEQIMMPREASLLRGLGGNFTSVVFLFLPESEMLATLRLASQNKWRSIFLVPGAFATSAALREFRTIESPAFLTAPFLPSDITPEAASLYAKLAAAYKLPSDRLPAQYTALCEAAILVEGLKRAGRDLSRVDLKESLEGLYDFPCGFGQPVTFTSSRHVGIEHYHIVQLNPESVPRH